MSKVKIILGVLGIQLLVVITTSMIDLSPKSNFDQDVFTVPVIKRSYPIEVHTVGELEAARSISISCAIRNEQPKVIELVGDGTNVNENELLVKIDPTPYEKRVEDLNSTIKDIESQIIQLENALAWDIEQEKHEAKASEYEIETAELELNKIVSGDGPLETARLFASMQKAEVKFNELNSFVDDLKILEEQDLLNPTEIRQTQKKLQEEKENYENAKLQYDSYVKHVFPMQVKKGETALKRMLNKQEESKKNSTYKIAKSQVSLAQIQQQLVDAKRQHKDACNELTMTEIRAPSPGMVVLKDDYRAGQKRKPRVGDILVRNQGILDLPDMSSMIVKTKVREIDLYKVEIGKNACIEVDAYPNLLFEGKVIFIGILAISDAARPGDEKSFEVKVALDNTDPRLRPGMTSRVTIHAGKVEDTLSIPIHAVFEKNKQHYCYIAAKKYYVQQPIEIGMNNEQWVAVLAGLKENDRICLSIPEEATIIDPSTLTEDFRNDM